jgi:ankyrin repeat protein
MIKISCQLLMFLLFIVSITFGESLHEAIKKDDLKSVKAIIDSIPDIIDIPDDDNMTPLCIAAANGNSNIVTILLDKGANLMIGDADSSQPIHFAALKGHTNIVELLISKGAGIDAKDNNGVTPLSFALSYRFPNTALWLIENGANVSIANNRDVTPLHYAVIRGYSEIVDRILKRGVQVDAADEEKETALHYAAQAGEIEIAGLLIDHGANLEIRNAYGRTPLLLTARESGNTEMARFLVSQGANVNAMDNSGDTPLTLTAWRGFKSMVNFLLDSGAKLPQTERKLCLLAVCAADRGLTRLFQNLVDAGVNISFESVTGGSLLHQAAGGGSEEIIKILHKNELDVNGRDRYGRTPLHYAAEKGREETTRLLISLGANLNVRSLSGRTPFNVAEEFKRNNVATILKESGADTSAIKFPELSGLYLGQKLPGPEPQRFALDIVSTNQFEHGCLTFMPDGREVYWTSSIRESDSGYVTGFIMTSRIENGHWALPELANFSRIGTHDDIPVISPDGKRLFFLSRRGPSGMWYVEREENGWSDPKYIQGGPNEQRPYWQFSVAASGNIYFSSRGDIFISKPIEEHYASAEMLDPTINTPYGEGQVCIAPDESYLIFGTNGYPDSLGGDCFRIVFRDNLGKWGKPLKLMVKGNPLTGICPVLSPDGKYLFFNNMSTGTTDIYWVDAAFIKSLH